MPLTNLRPWEITEEVLLKLYDGQVPEGKTIDYKAELPGTSDAARKDFLADLSSFANASGGHIVYGMEEAEGIPTNLLGLSSDVDQAILRLESMARDGIRPPIPGLELVRVAMKNGNNAVVISVPKSWNPPHQVIFQKDFRFYTRGSAGRQHFDVEELRRVVLLSQQIGERVRQFRASRVAAVMSAETPVPLVAGGRQVVHFVPLSAFDAGVNVDLKRVLSDRGLFITTTNRGGSLRHNVDGLLAYSQSDGAYDAYAQFFRNGALEIVVHVSKWAARTGELVLPSLSFEEEIFAQAKAALRVLAMAGVTMPVVMMLSFVGIKGWEMGVKDSWGIRGKTGGFDRDPRAA